jgi:galactokinase/galacturonokinase
MEKAYKSIFDDNSQLFTIFSPYRICPLGAHVDHQHGLVSGFAINKGVDFIFSITENSTIDIHSLSYKSRISFDFSHENNMTKQNNWGDYLKAAIYALQKRVELSKGIKGVIKGNLPIGGLSSSAAVLVAYVMALTKANNIKLTKTEIIKITSEAEREFIGLNNGILDQACVVLSEKEHLLYLDTDTNEYQLLPVHQDMQAFEVGIIFSGLTRTLISTDYNLRVSECKTAAWNILAFKNQALNTLEKTYLRDVPEEYYLEVHSRLPQRFAKRAIHFYTECDRVKRGVNEWQKGDLKALGKLIFESCESSIHNYECGSPELIALYEMMKETEGIYGGRFSGAGFKGACICLVDPNKKEYIRKRITNHYLRQFPEYADSFEIHFCKTDTGSRFIELQPAKLAPGTIVFNN